MAITKSDPHTDLPSTIRQRGYRMTPQRPLIMDAVMVDGIKYEKIGSKVYEMAAPQPHHHLVCEHCGNVEQVTHDAMAGAFKHIEQKYGFKVTTDHLALFGLCRHCRPGK